MPPFPPLPPAATAAPHSPAMATLVISSHPCPRCNICGGHFFSLSTASAHMATPQPGTSNSTVWREWNLHNNAHSSQVCTHLFLSFPSVPRLDQWNTIRSSFHFEWLRHFYGLGGGRAKGVGGESHFLSGGFLSPRPFLPKIAL
eukprot:881846-Pelagomonas_calceolata.AAC.3